MENWSKQEQLRLLRTLSPDEAADVFASYIINNHYRLCKKVLLNAFGGQNGKGRFIGLYIKMSHPLPDDVEVKLIKSFKGDSCGHTGIRDYLSDRFGDLIYLYMERGNTFSDRALDEIRHLPHRFCAEIQYDYFDWTHDIMCNTWRNVLQKLPLEKRLRMYEKAKRQLPYKAKLKGRNLDLVNFYQAFRLYNDEGYGGYQHFLDETLEEIRLVAIKSQPDNPYLSRERFREDFLGRISRDMELIPQEDQDFLMKLIIN